MATTKKSATKKSSAKKATKKAAPKAKTPRATLPSQNGVTRPKDGTQTGAVWAIADSISSKTRKPATRSAVLEEAIGSGVNPATAATQYGRWRKFNGLEGRLEKAAPKAAPKAKKAPAKKRAARKSKEAAPEAAAE